MLEFLLFIIGLFFGAFLAWTYFSKKNKEANAEKFLKKEAKIQDLEEKLKISESIKIKALTELDIYKKSEFDMKESFENVANRIMQKNNEQFIKQAKETFGRFNEEAYKDFKNSKTSISEIIKPLSESLLKHEELMKLLKSDTDKTFGSLRNYIEELGKSQHRLEKETGALVNALKAPKVRGKWGEIGLKRLVEYSGMSEFCDFETQVHTSNNDGVFRPDMIVNLPGEKKIVIDSKVPLNAYLEMLETEDEETKSQLKIRHAKAVLTHVKELSKKAYWSQFDNSVDFVILYIEVEPAFGTAFSENKNLVAEAAQNRIIFATPTTLIAMLQTVAYSWKQHEATENAIEIWKSSRDIYERLSIFSEHLNKIGKNISSLTNTYNDAIGSWDRRVIPGIKKMESLGVSSQKKKIVESSSININIKKLDQ